ncbi:MAG: DNA polymerase III subunit alpha [Candidatus Omnitrophota bacterium]
MIHSDFVHLHIHTQYSLLDGACHLEKLVDKASRLKLPALAITDHGNLFGAIKFYNLCLKRGVKPIIGCEVYVAPQSRFKKEYKQSEESNYHLILLAKDEQGYRNLLRLVSLGHLEGFYYKPRIDRELLIQYNQGLIATSACLKGEIASSIVSGNLNQAYKQADDYLNIFGKGNFYVEIMENGIKEQAVVNKNLLKIGKDLAIPLIATNDVHYLEKEESFAHEVLLSIQTQNTLNDPSRFKFGSDTFYFRTPLEMKEIFKDIPGALRNTLEIMQKCNLVFDFSQVHLPKFPLPAGISEDVYLREMCFDNVEKRYGKMTDRIRDRLEYELSVIGKTGFSSYFLIIWDLVKFAKENMVPVGPGRGSAAGSIVSYLLAITDIDPLRYNLIFERFLNPDRISMPDIDIDFCYEKRVQVLEYVGERYGKDNVAQIITFGTMLARAVIRDVGRVMGLSYSDVDKIAKTIPVAAGHNVDLKEALKISDELKTIYNNDSQIKQLIDVAIQLEGLSRHASTHAAGVVISDKPLIERIPLVRGSDGEIVTGFDMDSLEKTGLLKMDFLGLKTLTVIDAAIRIIKRTQDKDINIPDIPLNDKKTFRLLCKGDTIGVFQLESRGMREILKRIEPSKFEDLIAVLALYRPGPLGSGMVDDYIERKHGRKPLSYLHPKMEPFLKETYGIIIYQEQTMQIASNLAGFSLSQADLLRKAIGKKIPEIMQEQKSLFVEGCKNNNIPEKTATIIFDLIDYFSGYGFNKSHSTAYALISYQTAYLKANFGVEFMAALLTSERNNTDKVVEYVNESRRMGIKVFPPDINESYTNFTVTKDKDIRFGLLAIKNVGHTALVNILAARKEKKFEDFFDFCQRAQARTVNRKVLESLIKSGALDTFNLKRAQMVVMLDAILDRASRKAKQPAGQFMFFDSNPRQENIPSIEEWPTDQILSFEKSLLGIYVSSHPLDAYKDIIGAFNIKNIASFYEESFAQDVVAAGVVTKVKVTVTRRKNEKMAIVKLDDQTSSLEVFVFPRLYEEVAIYLKESKIVFVKGGLQIKDKMPKLLANDFIPVENVFSKVKGLNIVVQEGKINLNELKDVFARHKGEVPVYFVLKNNPVGGMKIRTSESFHLSINQASIKSLIDTLGTGNFSLTL